MRLKSKFDRAPARKTPAQFSQIENKLDAVTNVQLAQGIPLIAE